MMKLDELKAVRDEWEGDVYDLDEKLASGEISEHDNMYAKAIIELHHVLSDAIGRIEELEAENKDLRTKLVAGEELYISKGIELERCRKLALSYIEAYEKLAFGDALKESG